MKRVNRREQIMSTARALLLEREGAFTIQLLERSGASVGSLYHHFGNKDGVLAAVADDVVARYQDALAIALLKAGAGERPS